MACAVSACTVAGSSPCCLEPKSPGGSSGESQISSGSRARWLGSGLSQEPASLPQGDLQSQAMVRAVARQVCEQLIQSKCVVDTDVYSSK